MKEIRLAFCGPSGSGKTTLALWVQQEFNIPYIKVDNQEIINSYGAANHEEMIRKSHIDPMVGINYQSDLLHRRVELMRKAKYYTKNFVMDRSPVDNIVYFILQCSAYTTQDMSNQYRDEAQVAMGHLTHIVYLPFTSETVLENNGIRVNNPLYQMATDMVFDGVINKIFDQSIYDKTPLLTIPFWDLEARKNAIRKFLSL